MPIRASRIWRKPLAVNKSGLYSEFRNKEDIYLACLEHYMVNRGGAITLAHEPLGWSNIEAFLKMACYHTRELKGCFMVYTLRDCPILSASAQAFIAQARATMKECVRRNIEVEKTIAPADEIAGNSLSDVLRIGSCPEYPNQRKNWNLCGKRRDGADQKTIAGSERDRSAQTFN